MVLKKAFPFRYGYSDLLIWSEFGVYYELYQSPFEGCSKSLETDIFAKKKIAKL